MKIWIRLGATLDISEAQAKNILNGNKNALLNVVRNHSPEWWVAGESIIPVEGNEHLGIEDNIEFQI